MRWLSLWVQRKQGITRNEIQERVERTVNMGLDDYGDTDGSRNSADDHLDPDEEIIVDGLMLEDCGDVGLIERWCVVTREAFLICSRKECAPSYTIPFKMVASVTQDDRKPTPGALSALGNATLLKGDLMSQERQRAPGSPGIQRTASKMQTGLANLEEDDAFPSSKKCGFRNRNNRRQKTTWISIKVVSF